MTAKINPPIAARLAPRQTEGLLAWMRLNLFGDKSTSLMTILIGGVLLYLTYEFLDWAIFRAAWRPDYEACRVDGVGAC